MNIEEISGIDYKHAEKVFNKFKIKNLGEYHDLYGQSDTILLADVFENLRNMCIGNKLEISLWIRSCLFFISTRISMASLFKGNRCKIRINN